MSDVTPVDEELHRLYSAHYDGLVRLALLFLREGGAAEEVVQDAFVALFRRWGKLNEPDKALAYLRGSVMNGCRSRLRHNKVVAKHSTPAPEPLDDSAEHRGLALLTRHTVLDAVAALPRRQREVVLLRYYLDLSEADIARALGISAGAVKGHAHRASHTLRLTLEGLK